MSGEPTITELLGLDEKSVTRMITTATRDFYDAWSALAPNKAYRDGLSHKMVSAEVGEVTLAGQSVWLERGSRARDMREGLLNSPKAKISPKGGRYIAVPIGMGMATASDRGKPWWYPGRDGARCLIKLKLKSSEILGNVWARRRDGPS